MPRSVDGKPARSREEERDPERRRRPSEPQRPAWAVTLVYVAIGLGLLWIWQGAFDRMTYEELPYSELKRHLERGHVVEARVGTDEIEGRIRQPAGAEEETPAAEEAGEPVLVPRGEARPGEGTAEGGEREFLFRTVRVEDPELVEELVAQDVRFQGVRPNLLTELLWAWILPLSLLVLFWFLLFRRMGGAAAGQSPLSFGKSRARVVVDRETGVRFEHVAGCDEAKADLTEVVQFLQSPERFQALGAKIPKGVLLVGPPGTGKTLLARAVAGEAGVPFFQLSGSEFVEMFVGVGAARVRDLFEQAKRQAPCIVFIDELDAIGRQRGVAMGVTHDEREQTLNQLLVEMDGFEPNTGVILLAATNRPEVLDRALLRPGRFDRQVLLDAPNLEGRVAILEVHARGKPLAKGVELRRVAQATPGFSGADLANVINEAALLAARLGAKKIEQAHLDEAVEKVIAGPERKSRVLSAEDKRRVAYHETGHAVVAAHCTYADPVRKISIVPRGRAALGYTLQLPTGEQYLMSRSELLDKIKGLLGGRAAEELVFDEVSTGAANDLQQATHLVRQMVTVYGMGQSVRLANCARPQGPQFLTDAAPLQRDCSEETAREIDEEVIAILDEAYGEARGILEKHRDQLEHVASTLIERETIDGEDFYRLVGVEEPREA